VLVIGWMKLYLAVVVEMVMEIEVVKVEELMKEEEEEVFVMMKKKSEFL
jgi:hypothetical protein